MPGIQEWSKRRRLSRNCKASALSGAQVPRGGEAHRSESGERSSCSRRGARRWNAPRSSWNTSLFAGRRWKRRPQWRHGPLSRLRSRDGQAARREQHAREGPPLVAVLRRQRGARNRFEKGPRPPKDGANLGSSRPGPAGTLLRKSEPAWLVSPEIFARAQARQKKEAAKVQRRFVALFAQYEEAMQLVVGARASSSLQKSAGRPRARRSAPSASDRSKAFPVYRRRVNGSLTGGGLQRVSEGGHRRQKGDGSLERGGPHHVSAERE
jgi:hypothetical protein